MPEEPSRRARKRARTRELLVGTAARLFHERGYDVVTISQIAEAAEVSHKAVYNDFPTKEALVLDEDEAFAAPLATIVADRPPGTPARPRGV